MLNKLEQFIRDNFTPYQETTSEEQLNEKLKIATTVLFLEMAYIDFNLASDEEDQISKILTDLFDLNHDQVQELIEISRQQRDSKTDLWTFASLIKTNFSREQKINILEKLWMIIFADGKVDKFEDNLIHKISDLLGLDHSEMISAKIKVKNKLNIE